VGDSTALNKLVYEQAGLSLGKRMYLTHEELERRFGAAKDDIDAVERYAQRHDLQVVHRSAAERCVVVKGRLSDLVGAFHADLQIYHHAAGTYRGRTGSIGLPDELSGIVTGIFGFDTRPRHRGRLRRALGRRGIPAGDGVAATDFAKRYEFPEAVGKVSLDGAGQTVAIIELGGGYRASDLQLYFQTVNLPLPQVTSVSVDHAGNGPSTPDSDDGEVMLDIEVAGAVVPKAAIAVYFAPNNGDKGFIDAISAAVHDEERKPSVISISWGGPESANDQQGTDAFHEIFVAAAALGITICVASGDHGTADLDGGHWDGGVHVDHPACDDLVLGCGGTQIVGGQDVVWNDGTAFDANLPGGGGWASGGGISEVFPVPQYQASANLPVSIVSGKPGRGVPDIAMSATNYFVRVDKLETASGGTSAVAPLMASLIARLNQAKGKNVGFINPFLYGMAVGKVVQPVTSGNNAIDHQVAGYTAGPGWSGCTGLGTPNGTAILNNL
jgi:kumamolisin